MVKTYRTFRHPAERPPIEPDPVPGSDMAPATAPPPRIAAPAPAPVPARTPPRTIAGSTWVVACIAVLVLVVLIVFIAQNSGPVRISFFTLHGRFPLAVTLLAAVAAGSVLTLAVGSTRILQLRRIVRRHHREDLAATARATQPQTSEIPPELPRPADPSFEQAEGKAVDRGADV